MSILISKRGNQSVRIWPDIPRVFLSAGFTAAGASRGGGYAYAKKNRCLVLWHGPCSGLSGYLAGRILRSATLLFVVFSVFACADDNRGNEQLPVAGLGELQAEVVRPVAEYREQALYKSADLARGERLYEQCVVCHSLTPSGGNGQGPSLWGVIGRQAGKETGFDYSEALAGAGFAWTPNALNAWLAAPLKLLPASQMPFAGIYDAKDRADLIAYILSVAEPD